MPEQITRALEVLGVVMIYATAWFVGFTSIMRVPAVWRKFKKMSDKEKKEHEEIKLKRAEAIIELDKERTSASDEIIKLNEEILALKEKKALLAKEIRTEKKNAAKESTESTEAEADDEKASSAPARAKKQPSKGGKKQAEPAPA